MATKKGMETTDASERRAWRRLLDRALEATGGPLTERERAWADGILKKRPARKRRKRRES
jgi:hypothetical protein